MTRLLGTIFAVLALAALTGCNTMQGMGQDVSAAGRAVSKSAEKVKEGM